MIQVRVQIILEQWQSDYIHKKAKKTGRSICSIMREYINVHLTLKMGLCKTKKEEDKLAFTARKLTEGRWKI